MKNNLQNEIDSTKTELMEALSHFEQENFNIIPFEGSWTAGQVAEHILMSISGILQTVKGPAKLAERDPEEHVKQLRDAFLNMDIKMKSPDFILPSDEKKDKLTTTKNLGNILDGIKEVSATTDPALLCTGFEMPMLGPLTRTEWISFAAFHTQRHIYQLNNIAKAMNIKTL